MATTMTCPHGLDRGSCLVCATLGSGPPVNTPAQPVPARGGRGEGLDQRHGIRLGLLGWLVVVVAVLFGAWFLVHLVWTFLHLVELALVGIVGAAVGYRVGVAVGRHQSRQGRPRR